MDIMPPLWPSQQRGIDQTIQAIESGERSILLTSPTGSGKTRIMIELILWALWKKDWSSVVYSNRKMLLEQTSKALVESGVEHGIRAADFQADLMQRVQLSSIQTERSRVYDSERWKLHPAKLVLIDEAHVNGGDTAERIINEHRESGAAIVGVTATPLGLAHIYSTLIIASKMSELRECGALVPAIHYGPDEPDLKHIEKIKIGDNGEFSESEVRKVFKVQKVFGRIVEWYNRLNPDRVPAILFAPGVKESVWCAQEFCRRGIPAAHIDGEDIWIDGEQKASDKESREELAERSKNGSIKVVCNRFVLREGINWPWLEHGILATVFGGLQSYIQSCGRLLRAYPGKTRAVIQDHGGAWHRHGSINADRDWELDLTNRIATGLRIWKLRDKEESEPIRCAQCGAIRNAGKQCPACSYESPIRKRVIIQADGMPKEMSGDIYRARRVARFSGIEDKWKQMYHRGRSRCKNGDKGATFLALEALFAYENSWAWPPHDLPYMPRERADWFRPVDEVPAERLLT